MSDDPLRIVWDALAAYHGRAPTGSLDSFRSACTHPGADNPTALHVSRGAGGVALLCCHTRHCPHDEIVTPLGLGVRDLYPHDPGDSGRRLRTARREDFTGNARTLANVLLALGRSGERWGLALWLDECPNCERPHAQLSINASGEPRFYCERGCDLRMVEQALADRVTYRDRKTA